MHITYKRFYKGSRGSIKVRVANRCIFSMFATKCFQQDISCSMQVSQQTSFKVVRNNFVELLSSCRWEMNLNEGLTNICLIINWIYIRMYTSNQLSKYMECQGSGIPGYFKICLSYSGYLYYRSWFLWAGVFVSEREQIFAGTPQLFQSHPIWFFFRWIIPWICMKMKLS